MSEPPSTQFSEPLPRRAFLARTGQTALGMTALGALLGACGGSSKQGAGGKDGPQRTVGPAVGTVTLWYTIVNEEQREYYVRSNIEEFRKSHPRITLKASQKPVETADRVTQTALQAGSAPDIVIASGVAQALKYVEADYLLELDAYAEHYNWPDKVLRWALDAGRVDGKLYSVPTNYETIVVFYNRSLFEQRGWHPPNNRAELEALAQDAQASKVVPFMAGNAEWRPATEWFVSAFLNHGAGPQAVYEALRGERPWTDERFLEAVTLMSDWFKRGWFGGGVKQYFTNRFAPQYAAFAEGRAAMNLEGSWAFESIPGAFEGQAEWDWFPVPPLLDGAPSDLYSLATGGTMSINARSEAPDAAAAYLDFQFSTPQRVAAQLAEVGIAPPPVVLERSDFPTKADERVLRLYTSLGAATSTGTFGYTTWTFWPPRSNAYIYEQMEKVLVGDLEPREYLEGLDRLFRSELRRDRVPPAPPQRS